MIRFLPPHNRNEKAPLFVYLPGMDGTGELLRSQMANLEQAFDVRRLSIPSDDLTDWDGLTARTTALIKAELGDEIPRRPLYLCGESFGGCLALMVVLLAPELSDRLILVNPASSFNRHPWIQLGVHLTRMIPHPFYPYSCIGFLPVLSNLGRIEAEDRYALLRVMQSVSLESVLWRLSLLETFRVSPNQLQQIHQPTLIVASESDRLLPSRREAELLMEYLPDAHLHLLPDSGHAALLESEVNLYAILGRSEFLPDAKELLEKQAVSARIEPQF